MKDGIQKRPGLLADSRFKIGLVSRLSPRAVGWTIALALGVGWLSSPASVEAGWGMPYPQRRVVRMPPDQSWLLDVPEKAGARSRGKVAVFAFNGDDAYQPVRAAVVRALRKRGLNVTATLRPVDSEAQYREMSVTLKLAVFVEGELKGEGARQSALIRLRSGVTGRTIASVKFSGPTQKLVGDVGHTLWNRVGATMMRTCTSASRDRQLEREPLRIEAGNPVEETSPGT